MSARRAGTRSRSKSRSRRDGEGSGSEPESAPEPSPSDTVADRSCVTANTTQGNPKGLMKFARTPTAVEEVRRRVAETK